MAKKKSATSRAKVATPPQKKEQTQIASEDLPRRSIEVAQKVVEAINRNYANNSVSWEEIANLLGVSAKNTVNRYPIWAAVAYGMLTRSEVDSYELTETGRKLVAPEYPGDEAEGRLKALLTPRILSKFFTDFDGHSLPEQVHFPNVLENRYQIPRDRTAEAIKLIIDNGQYAGVIQERPEGPPIVRLDASRSTAASHSQNRVFGDGQTDATTNGQMQTAENDWQSTCFFLSPIGDEGTEQRSHADMILKHVVEPAASENGLTVVRADKIERSGLITQQIFEQLTHARVCVADLSFTNANVFYELGVRHTCKLPSVQLIRKGDKIPFDVAQGRTITIDTTSIYTIADRLSSAQRELSEHLKHIMASDSNEPGEDNPVHLYLPKLRVSI